MKILILHHDLDLQKVYSAMLIMAGYQCFNTDDSNYALDLLRSQPVDGLVMDAEYWDSVYQVMKSSSELGNIGIFVIFGSIHRVKDSFVDVLKSYGDDFHYEILIEAKDLVISMEKVLRRYNKLLPTAQERRMQIDRQRDKLKEYYSWSDEKLDERYERLWHEIGVSESR